jgi:hypothetical protein
MCQGRMPASGATKGGAAMAIAGADGPAPSAFGAHGVSRHPIASGAPAKASVSLTYLVPDQT